MSARRLTSTTLVSLCALAGFLALGSGSAQAVDSHLYLPGALPLMKGVPAEGPHGEQVPAPGPLTLIASSMAIDSGHLWIAELSGAPNKAGESIFRVDEFSASTGAFISQIAHSDPPPNIQYGEDGIAIGHRVPGETEVYVGEQLAGNARPANPAVAVFSESGTEKLWTGAGTPAGSFGEAGIGDVAVDNNSTNPLDEHKGDVYVTVPGQEVIDIFHPEADGEEHYVGQIAGVSPSEPFKSLRRLAVSEANGDVVVMNGEEYDILEPAALGEYVLAGRIAGTPGGPLRTFNLAVDGVNGEIYVTDGFNPTVIDQFGPTGAYEGRITGAQTPRGHIEDVYSLAVDPESEDVYVADVGNGAASEAPPIVDVFGPDIVIPDATTGPTSGLTPEGATLNGTVNPNKAGQATCRFEWGTSTDFGKFAPCEPETVTEGASPVPVHAVLSGLQPDTTYYYRLLASNKNGTNSGEVVQNQSFTTPGPGVRDESVADVTSTSATLSAAIDPHGVPASYYFQYSTAGTAGCDASPASCTSVPTPPGEAIGSGEEVVEILPHHIQGLLAGTIYHYRVVVISEVKPGEFATFDGPDRTFTTQTAAKSTLPDGRQWEMVSPPDKKGAFVEEISGSDVIQAAADGSAFTFTTNAPTEAEPQGNAGVSHVLSTRGPGGWSSRDISPPLVSAPGVILGSGSQYPFFSEDLSRGVLQPFGVFVPQLSAEGSERTAYLAQLTTPCSGSCARPLVTGKAGFANVPPGTRFGEEGCESICGPLFIDATPDLSHIVLRSEAALTPEAVGASTNQLYEWTEGKLTLISLLPNNGGTATQPQLGANNRNARGAMSSDGSRVVWEAHGGTGSQLYMREVTRKETVQLDAAEPDCVAEGKCESGEGVFQSASTDGSKVLFTDQRRLTKDSGSSDLYQCEMVQAPGGKLECKLSDLTPAGRNAAGERVSAEVLGSTLASEDGSYVYFVANAALAEDAVPGRCESGVAGATCNLYVRHGGVTKLVAILSAEDRGSWYSELVWMSSRVSPDGRWLAFMSHRSLTGYDNLDAVSGVPDDEVYLYDASSGRVVCASCNPTGARPVGVEGELLTFAAVGGPIGLLQGDGGVAANVPGWTGFTTGFRHQPRYLSDSGRLFFDSNDALVPQDVDGTQDVYQYEPTGVGDCQSTSVTFNAGSDGCVGLISAGTSAEESVFLDASESGGDVFFMTFSRLAPQDYDASADVYDAHECTQASPCFPAPAEQPPACTTADACRAAPTPQPALFGAPSSATFSGAGNIVPEKADAKTRVKSLTRAQGLARALKACKRKPRKKQAGCERHAKAQYGPAKTRKSASKKGNR